MTVYLDASVIVPAVVREQNTDLIDGWLETVTEALVTGRLVAGEAGSAISRKRRMRDLTDEQGERALLASLDSWLTVTVTIIDHEPIDLAEAARFVRRPFPKLLMPDAIHLAMCRRLNMRFVTSDQGLLPVASLLGVDCVLLRPS